MADESGIYAGHNQQFSGSGYADMHFEAIATSPEQFKAWVQKARQSPNQLDLSRYEELKKPTPGYPVTYFSSVTPGLFDHIIREYLPMSMGVNSGARSRDDSGSTRLKAVALERR